MTVNLKDETGDASYVLQAGDSVHFAKGVERSCLNTGCTSAQMLVIMIKK